MKTEIMQELGQYINEQCEEIAKAEINKAIEKAKSEIERNIRAKIGEIATRLTESLSYERCGSDLKITVHFPNMTKPS